MKRAAHRLCLQVIGRSWEEVVHINPAPGGQGKGEVGVEGSVGTEERRSPTNR